MYQINYFLQKYFHIKINRSRLFPNKADGENLIIEFLGTPGVGKTFLLRNYLNQSKYKSQLLSTLFLNQFTQNNYYNIKLDPNSFYDRLLRSKIVEIANRWPQERGDKKLDIVLYAKHILINDVLMTNHFQNKNLILDEGMSHFFMTNLVEEMEKEKLKKIFKNRIFVYCYCSPEEYVKNRRINKELSEEIRFENIKRDMAKTESNFEVFKFLNVPFCYIDTANNLEQNIELIDNFIQPYLK